LIKISKTFGPVADFGTKRRKLVVWRTGQKSVEQATLIQVGAKARDK
jgi:hypothetical protein